MRLKVEYFNSETNYAHCFIYDVSLNEMNLLANYLAENFKKYQPKIGCFCVSMFSFYFHNITLKDLISFQNKFDIWSADCQDLEKPII